MPIDMPPVTVQDAALYEFKNNRPAQVMYLAQGAPSQGSLEAIAMHTNSGDGNDKPEAPRDLVEKAIELYEEKSIDLEVGYEKGASKYIKLMKNTITSISNFKFNKYSESEKEIIGSMFANYALSLEKSKKDYNNSEKYNLLALEINPKSEATLVNLGILYLFKLKEYEKSFEIGKKLIEIYPGHKRGETLIKVSRKKLNQ